MLRDYQQAVFDATTDSFRAGHRRPLVVLPCGAGKSYIFAEMAKRAKHGETLILTHRRELLSQHSELLNELGVDNTRIAMVLTEYNRLGKYDKPGLIITDEAHLSRSNSWMHVMEYYDAPTVGFTATPQRLDGKPLGDIYDDLIVGVGTHELIKRGCLSDFDYYAPMTVDTDNVKHGNGDFVISDLDELMRERAIYSDVLKSWTKFAGGIKTIAYCVSIKHAQETAERFSEAGHPAACLSSHTPATERENVMSDFRSGKITVLCNVGIISEGVSIDDVGCCLLLRPTESLALYWQQAMRCLRFMPNKRAIILDCVGNYSRNPIPGADVEWNLNKSVKHQRINKDGDFTIRTCPACFRVFHTAPVCPYCGTEYPLHPREIRAHKEIELQKITAEEQAKAESERKQARRQQGMARTFPELVALAKERGYANPSGWAYMVMKGRNK